MDRTSSPTSSGPSSPVTPSDIVFTTTKPSSRRKSKFFHVKSLRTKRRIPSTFSSADLSFTDTSFLQNYYDFFSRADLLSRSKPKKNFNPVPTQKNIILQFLEKRESSKAKIVGLARVSETSSFLRKNGLFPEYKKNGKHVLKSPKLQKNPIPNFAVRSRKSKASKRAIVNKRNEMKKSKSSTNLTHSHDRFETVKSRRRAGSLKKRTPPDVVRNIKNGRPVFQKDSTKDSKDTPIFRRLALRKANAFQKDRKNVTNNNSPRRRPRSRNGSAKNSPLNKPRTPRSRRAGLESKSGSRTPRSALKKKKSGDSSRRSKSKRLTPSKKNISFEALKKSALILTSSNGPQKTPENAKSSKAKSPSSCPLPTSKKRKITHSSSMTPTRKKTENQSVNAIISSNRLAIGSESALVDQIIERLIDELRQEKNLKQNMSGILKLLDSKKNQTKLVSEETFISLLKEKLSSSNDSYQIFGCKCVHKAGMLRVNREKLLRKGIYKIISLLLTGVITTKKISLLKMKKSTGSRKKKKRKSYNRSERRVIKEVLLCIYQFAKLRKSCLLDSKVIESVIKVLIQPDYVLQKSALRCLCLMIQIKSNGSSGVSSRSKIMNSPTSSVTSPITGSSMTFPKDDINATLFKLCRLNAFVPLHNLLRVNKPCVQRDALYVFCQLSRYSYSRDEIYRIGTFHSFLWLLRSDNEQIQQYCLQAISHFVPNNNVHIDAMLLKYGLEPIIQFYVEYLNPAIVDAALKIVAHLSEYSRIHLLLLQTSVLKMTCEKMNPQVKNTEFATGLMVSMMNQQFRHRARREVRRQNTEISSRRLKSQKITSISRMEEKKRRVVKKRREMIREGNGKLNLKRRPVYLKSKSKSEEGNGKEEEEESETTTPDISSTTPQTDDEEENGLIVEVEEEEEEGEERNDEKLEEEKKSDEVLFIEEDVDSGDTTPNSLTEDDEEEEDEEDDEEEEEEGSVIPQFCFEFLRVSVFHSHVMISNLSKFREGQVEFLKIGGMRSLLGSLEILVKNLEYAGKREEEERLQTELQNSSSKSGEKRSKKKLKEERQSPQSPPPPKLNISEILMKLEDREQDENGSSDPTRGPLPFYKPGSGMIFNNERRYMSITEQRLLPKVITRTLANMSGFEDSHSFLINDTALNLLVRLASPQSSLSTRNDVTVMWNVLCCISNLCESKNSRKQEIVISNSNVRKYIIQFIKESSTTQSKKKGKKKDTNSSKKVKSKKKSGGKKKLFLSLREDKKFLCRALRCFSSLSKNRKLLTTLYSLLPISDIVRMNQNVVNSELQLDSIKYITNFCYDSKWHDVIMESDALKKIVIRLSFFPLPVFHMEVALCLFHLSQNPKIRPSLINNPAVISSLVRLENDTQHEKVKRICESVLKKLSRNGDIQ